MTTDPGDVSVQGATVLPPRATIALLTLRVRAAMNEATEAEAAAAALDADAAVSQLRARLGPLIEERRTALAWELDEERAACAASLAAARRAAESARAEQAVPRRGEDLALVGIDDLADPSELAGLAALAGLVATDPVDASPAADLIDVSVSEAGDVGDVGVVTPLDIGEVVQSDEPSDGDVADDSDTIDGVDDTTAVTTSADVTTVMPSVALAGVAVTGVASGGAGAVQVVLDPDSFARAFAAALAPVLEALERSPGPGSYLPPRYEPGPGRATRSSFWAHAWHPDVLLSALAMVIVIVVLIAWTG